MIRILHAADLHLGSPLRGLRAIAPDAALALKMATERAFEKLVDAALAQKADAVLLGGDLYEVSDVGIDARLSLRRGLERLAQQEIPVLVVHGNHDPLRSAIHAVGLPKNTTVFGEEWSEQVLTTKRGEVFRVQGVSHASSRVEENLAQKFRRVGPEPTVGLLHANVGGRPGHGNYAPCSMADLEAAKLDAWALGHVHQREVFALSSGGWAVYPGNLQGRHVNEAGPRGAVWLELEQRGAAVQVRTQFVSLEAVRFGRCALDVSECGQVNDWVDAAVELAQTQEKGGAEWRVLRVEFTGRTALWKTAQSKESWAGLEAELRSRLLPKRILLESLTGSLRPAIDISEWIHRGGAFAALAEEGPRDEQVQKDWRADPQVQGLVHRLRRLGVELDAEVWSRIAARGKARAQAALAEVAP